MDRPLSTEEIRQRAQETEEFISAQRKAKKREAVKKLLQELEWCTVPLETHEKRCSDEPPEFHGIIWKTGTSWTDKFTAQQRRLISDCRDPSHNGYPAGTLSQDLAIIISKFADLLDGEVDFT